MPKSIGSTSCGKAAALLPTAVQNYLIHTQSGVSIRAIARASNAHASTIQRQVRRIEARRDDPLIDAALDKLPPSPPPHQGAALMSISAIDIEKEARRVLRRLCETGAVLAVNAGLQKAVVMRISDTGAPVRTAVLDQDIAEIFALKDWIGIKRKGRVTTYEITHAGKAALKRFVADEKSGREPGGFAEAATPFADQHRDLGMRKIADADGRLQPVRFNLAESPLAVLARRREKDGSFFLTPEQVDAGERLREDFELAQMGPRVGQNWDRFLSSGGRGAFFADSGIGDGPSAARRRVDMAMEALGPGLRDIVLRICCFLEGFESAEKRMGWSARSGKVVLRIALTQLQRHYETRR